jgi:DNA polymerase-3 subunit epsilon
MCHPVPEITEGAIFVAHNVRFDYTFLRHEFQRLGYTYTRKQLCTVKMSRRAFPNLIGGYSLGNLIRAFDIQVERRHRAMADVVATVDVFERIIRLNGDTDFQRLLREGIRNVYLPEGLPAERIHNIPDATGVYYFYNEKGDVVYVGKSIHLKRRVMEHFRGKTNKAAKMERHVRDFSYYITGSELVALLMESNEIHRLQPLINKAQRGKGQPTGILQFQNAKGYECFSTVQLNRRNRSHSHIVTTYDKPSIAAMALFRAKTDFGLCDCLLHGKTGEMSCIYQQIGQCPGAGVGKEPLEEYNTRAEAARTRLTAAYDYDCLIVDEGRHPDEWAVVLIENGEYKGYGYYDSSLGEASVQQLKDSIKPQPNNSNIPGIIRTFVASKKGLKIIKLDG